MAETLKHTPFYALHVAAGAKMVPFAGFEMPVQYPEGITAEHLTVRGGAGLFDVTHMGEFEITGKDALAFASYVTSNDPGALTVGQVQYSCFTHESGGIVDDCLVYRFADKVMLVVNASNTAKDWAHVGRYAARSSACARSSAAPATRARTASRSSSTPARPCGCGSSCSRPAATSA